RVDVHRVDLWVTEKFVVIGVALRNSERLLDCLQLFRVTLADGDKVSVGMRLQDRNKFRSETETDDGDIDFFLRHECEEVGGDEESGRPFAIRSGRRSSRIFAFAKRSGYPGGFFAALRMTSYGVTISVPCMSRQW